MKYELVPLHENKQHFDDCARLLNCEWPRSKTAREHSLNKSCDGFPVCLVFRRVEGQEAVGFSQIVAVQGKDHACLVESVIVRKDLRGTGLGRRLMEATEEVARQKQMKTVYLNTLDKEDFYAHLGYTPCKAVTSLGANASRVSEKFLQEMLGGRPSCAATSRAGEHLSCGDPGTNVTATTSSAPRPPSLPPPPPPPPLPPPPPPPSSAGTSSGSQKSGKDGISRHILRMDPKAVTWMCKHLQ
ncbi:hypothetical protein ACOMHN_006447 [Nucella lapillus]